MSNQNTASNNDNVDNHEDINIEEGLHHCRVSTPTLNITNASATSGLELIEEDNSDQPLPMGMVEVILNTAESPKQIGKVEQLDDDDCPEPPAAMLEALLNIADPQIATKVTNNLASVNETSPPTPFDSTEYEDTDNTNTGRGDTNRRGWKDIDSGSNNDRDIESQTRTDYNDTAGSINDNNENGRVTAVEDINSDIAIHIPDAYVVEDVEEEVFIATPTLPWWKQRRTKIFISVVIVLVGALVVALGVSLSQSNNLGSESTNSSVTLFVTPPPTPPQITYECFGVNDGGLNGVLYKAVRSYVSEDCVNNEACPIAQIYGWPMNSWCVGNVKSMSW